MDMVMALSGGLDSTTLLGLLIENPDVEKIHCVQFNYGSKHNRYELQAAQEVVEYYRRRTTKEIIVYGFDLEPIMSRFSSALLKSSTQDIPEGAYGTENMSLTVVPARNLIFASIMAGLADSLGAEGIALGVHLGDHYVYPDCRKEFIASLDQTVGLATEGRVRVYTPLQLDYKEQVIKKGYSLEITPPYHLTRSCYKDQPISCGKCGTCVERQEAFLALDLTDPIEYKCNTGRKSKE